MKRMFTGCLVLTLGAGAASADIASTTSPTTAPAGETPSQSDSRLSWWRDARFGMFIHWGLYAVPAGRYDGKALPGLGEWIMHDASIPVATYAAYAERFNPVDFDADRWVSTAKNAGMKYVVVTAKHHDGFAMFHTKVDGFNIVDATPFKRDPLAELAAACRKAGIHLGFYYSQSQDWHHPGGAVLDKPHWDHAQDGSFDDYLASVAVPQVRELLTNYGPVSILWFDTPHEMTRDRAGAFVSLLHELQPQIIWNDRLGGGFGGDFSTPEQTIPSSARPGRDWESCMTINDTWGYKTDDTNFKSARTLIRNLIDVASKGGNYLLNVGPTAAGNIPQPEVDRLTAVGRWLDSNGEAIYGTTADTSAKPVSFGRVTRHGNRLYLCVFDLPADRTLRVQTASKVTKAYLLSDEEHPLAVDVVDGQLKVTLPPETPLDADATVVVVELEGETQPAP